MLSLALALMVFAAPPQDAPTPELILPAMRGDDGQVHMGLPALQVGDRMADAAAVRVFFNQAEGRLVGVRSASWVADWSTVRPDAAVDASMVLTAPDGQRWTARTRKVPAGGLPAECTMRITIPSSGFDDTGDLQRALEAGGRFTLAIEDGTGRRWNETVLDTLSPDERARLFAGELTTFQALDPATVGPVPPPVVLNSLPPRSRLTPPC